MNIRYRVALSQIEREHLTLRLNGGKHAARKLKRAQILLAADGGISDEAIASGVSVGDSCRRDTWCIPQLDGAHVACMEDGLDLYGEPADPKWPVVCFDESPTQLIGEVAPADSTGSGSA